MADALSSRGLRTRFARMRREHLLVLLLSWGGAALASPSAFPENAAYFSVGYNGTLAASLGGEIVIATPYLDTSLDLAVYTDLSSLFGTRLSGTALVFPAFGATPLALGFGADVGVNNQGASFHLGPVLGNDLLFVADVPMTVSAYLGLGYAPRSFSLAWALQLRYYLDDVALELASSDLLPLSLGVRYLF